MIVALLCSDNKNKICLLVESLNFLSFFGAQKLMLANFFESVDSQNFVFQNILVFAKVFALEVVPLSLSNM